MIIYAYNDVLGKGWDSAAQYSFCIQQSMEGDPQFWWVPAALRKFPHPPEWQHVKRDPDGKYKSFPGGKGKRSTLNLCLIHYAGTLLSGGYKKEAKQIMKLVQGQQNKYVFAAYQDLMDDFKTIDNLLRKGILNKLSVLLLLDKGGLADRLEDEIATVIRLTPDRIEKYFGIIRTPLLNMINLLQAIKQGKPDSEYIKTVDEILVSLQEVRNKHGI